jgi:hypothetical protein
VKKRKDKTDNVLLFRPRPGSRPPVEAKPVVSTAYFQIGSDRFAMHMWSESLPPLPPRAVLEPRIEKTTNLVLSGEGRSRVTASSPRGKKLRLKGE